MENKNNINIENIRKEINSVDSQIIENLSKRRELAKEIIKAKDNIKGPVRDKKRESDLLSRIIELGKQKGLDSHLISNVFYEIIEDSVRFQQSSLTNPVNESESSNKSIKVAIQGIDGSYSSLATKKFFKHSDCEIEFISKTTFEDVALALENKECDYSVLPIENTTSGGINEVYDVLLNSSFNIIGEEKYPVKHCLVTLGNVQKQNITKIFAHYQAALQCSKFLSKLPNCKIEYFTDTAMSVRKIVDENNPHYAAIASAESAELFDVTKLEEGIANQDENFTRFLFCSREPVEVDLRIPSKTSLILATEHKAGSLVDALTLFKRYGINLTKLESRPIIGNPWEEMFYIDFEGNIVEENVQNLMDELGRFTRFFKILGCYPSQEIVRSEFDKTVLTNDINQQDVSVEDGIDKKKSSKGKKSYKLASREYKEEDTIINVKGLSIGGDNFVVIAGPCSVESEDQVNACAAHAKETGAHILRGGCFKPRTSPYSFQGLGFEGLDLLANAGKTYNLPIITEVLAAHQVKEVAKTSDIIQIGARNMQNFILLKEAGKTHRPVLLKRGMMSSIDELLNAAEYILAQGNRQVILCERGIRTFETATRNTLDLGAVLVLKELSHLPVIVDPSHAIGQRDKILPLSKAAKVIKAHGVMIEFHPEPEKALSDGEQSLRFNQFKNLMNELSKI